MEQNNQRIDTDTPKRILNTLVKQNVSFYFFAVL